MGRLSSFDARALAQLLRRQDGLVHRSQAGEISMSDGALRHRIRPGGPWSSVLPGVYLCHNGPITGGQRRMAAFLYAGPQALAVTGPAALAWYGIEVANRDEVDVLMSAGCRRRSTGFARLHPTEVTPAVAVRDGALVYAPLARAIADTARWLDDLREIRAIVAAGVQRGKVQVWQLAAELDAGPVRRSALLRRALAEVAEGARSSAEADLMRLIRRYGLPEPMLNPRLFAGGEFLAMPDAWWPDAGVAAEVDSRQWHLAPADWEKTMARHARMSAHGIIVLHFPPSRIRRSGREVAGEIRATLASAGRRERLPILAQPAAVVPGPDRGPGREGGERSRGRRADGGAAA
jgi:hypothetical protein